MVAFVGAVICIIAAVHTGSPASAAAAAQPLADNQSLSPAGGVQTAVPGSADALQGAETGAGSRPTFPSGGAHATYSRLLCTPVPAGECKPPNFQQQADDPSLFAGEDRGYLRAAADELRHTVLQQKEEILTDQRTIRELTGKLSECEGALDAGGVQERGAGVWDESRDGQGEHMVRDEAPPSAAVAELERAIVQLKSRIEKLESEMGPQAHNHTGKGIKGGAGGLASARGGHGEAVQSRVEDMEGELARKMELLEKERMALRRESQKHRQHIDQGIQTLHQRIAGLEQGHFQGFSLSLPTRTRTMYGLVTRPVPQLHAFTVCLWLRPTQGYIGTPLSYAVPSQPNELVILEGKHRSVELLINDKVTTLPLNLTLGSWQHICVTWNNKGGTWRTYQGGKLKGEGKSMSSGHVIRPGGVLILGQEQDTLGGGFDASQAMVGDLSQLNLWDRVLRSSEVSAVAHCSHGVLGNVVPWTEQDLEVFGGASKELGEPCAAQHISAKQ
uniref:Pentraxin (PTX) domain-containing protein n=2 Tax=Denticeps clupeoides TaxID=299321 RepID=A0AAY4AP58_9TELE